MPGLPVSARLERMKTPFVWLGSGRTRKWPVSPKAHLLDKAAKAGLPVPPGAVLLDEFFQLVMAEGVVKWENGRYAAPAPDWLFDTIYGGARFPRLDKPAALRAAYSSDSGAVRVPPRLWVDVHDSRQFSHSLCDLWSAAAEHSLRRDVLIMEMVSQTAGGTAVSRRSASNDQVLKDGEAFSVSKLGRWERPSADLPDYARRLQQLLRGMRRTFGRGNWAVDWIDDGRICWLLQVQLTVINE